MVEHLLSKFKELYPELVDIRRDLHMYPEVGFKEENTPKKIAEYLRNIGIEVQTGVGGNGVVGRIRGGKPGKVVALRADFDALPIQDEKEVEYRSKVPGVMHACGHDVHTAVLLGVAKVLYEAREELEGDVVLIHQFAEEVIPGGAKQMIEAGCLDDVDVIYGAHVMSHEPFGKVGISEGYMMAAGDTFEIEIFGKGGHGGLPHTTVDPLLTGCQLVTNLQQIVSRRIDPNQPAVVSVCSFNSGEASNVISDSAKITGTVRTFDEDVRDYIEDTIGTLVKTTCEGVGATSSYTYQRGYPSLKNDTQETQRIERLAKNIVDEDQVAHISPMTGMEDFAYYLKEVPGTFVFVGGGNPEMNAVYPHHHPKFDVDERAMITIGQLFISAVFDYLNGNRTEK
ncbi:amidohydrolase [Desertibacillus haloalkaliphilus]|uniref:amidohydrolase n=1 Tax=Desertibacillus haloalkaliphilus TaxID=1328930 RepID=UPI001C277EFA|nr:amidohydrolase [Desertibacillus haloalkaliphilus]MBU8906322.1 amidohydrolase [Desertibacillus haloalkaliphilus]